MSHELVSLLGLGASVVHVAQMDGVLEVGSSHEIAHSNEWTRGRIAVDARSPVPDHAQAHDIGHHLGGGRGRESLDQRVVKVVLHPHGLRFNRIESNQSIHLMHRSI